VNTQPSQLLDYLRLVRLPNVFTALADVTMGFLCVQHTLRPYRVFLPLAAASALLYSAGMVLNDLWDVDLDRHQRPERPLPSGRITLATARRLGWTLLVGGVLCGWLAGLLSWGETVFPWRSGIVATLLACAIVAYDARLKRTLAGPLAMGACRALNVLLGMSALAAWSGTPSLAGFGPPHALTAGGIGLYIVGVTWFARREAEQSRRGSLLGATLVLLSGIFLLALLYAQWPPTFPRTIASPAMWYLLLGMLAFVIARRCGLAILDPSPHRVQTAVRHCIWSLIVLDASVALLVSSTAWSLVVLAYLIPTIALGRTIPST